MHPLSLLALLAATVSAAVAPRQSAVNPAVVPQSFGVTAGQGRDKVQVGSCTGANNKPIPCFCPPAPHSPEFLSKLSKALRDGFIFSIPVPISLEKFNDASDMSVDTQKLRATAMIQVLQNFNLTTQGVGCPGASAPVLLKMQQTGLATRDLAELGNWA
ncbi:514a2993-00e6-4c60-8a52-ab32ff899192 [Thermothielavioides terrestris]|uniref:514a2993-00e6-4c60-8a52-ab32ff899192 n=1 Tax=Thermothielavioides terrestris TaxID=2587410 RepID=A0A3S4AS76_9PEZI|nr:514a2993-00e6-4c60-8a52-ab32ff899192 [Thermothielavioides terrestris]